MSAAAAPPGPAGLLARPRRAFGRLAGSDLLGGLSVVILALLLLASLFGQQLAPYDANAQDLASRLVPPAWSDGGSLAHVLGTDQLGRDVFSRLLVGTRLTLLVGFAAAALEILIGATLGLIAGYRGGLAERAIMRWTDIQMGFPAILMVLLVILVLGSGPVTLTVALALNGWMVFARLVRAEVARIKNEPFAEAARVTGMPALTLLARHVVPHLRGRLTALYLMEVPRVILSAAALSFLGLGVTPPDVSWGLVIGDARSIIAVAPWASVFAGLSIVVTVASLYVFASWVEPRVDPLRRRGRRGAGQPTGSPTTYHIRTSGSTEK
jgi:peptide/nickel transport system permease protein